jgi:hypothetical protein
MILIKGQSKYARVERLVHKLDDDILSWIESLEESGFVILFTNLPSHINTHEVYAAILLDQFADMYLPETSTGH